MEMIEYIISEMRKVMPRGVEVETILRHYADRIERRRKPLKPIETTGVSRRLPRMRGRTQGNPRQTVTL